MNLSDSDTLTPADARALLAYLEDAQREHAGFNRPEAQAVVRLRVLAHPPVPVTGPVLGLLAGVGA